MAQFPVPARKPRYSSPARRSRQRSSAWPPPSSTYVMSVIAPARITAASLSFYYLVKCRMLRNGQIMGEGDGSCNSHESKYRYRTSERACPACGNTTIKLSKFPPKGSPQGTKPGWYCYAKIGGCGAEFAAEGSQNHRTTNRPHVEPRSGRPGEYHPEDGGETRPHRRNAHHGQRLATTSRRTSKTCPALVRSSRRRCASLHRHLPAPTPNRLPMLSSASSPAQLKSAPAAQPSQPHSAAMALAANHAIREYEPKAAAFAAEFAAYRTKSGAFDDGNIRASILANLHYAGDHAGQHRRGFRQARRVRAEQRSGRMSPASNPTPLPVRDEPSNDGPRRD